MAGAGLAEEIVAADEAAVVEEFVRYLEQATAERHPAGPRRRFNQGRAAGCVEAELTVPPDLPPDHRVGLFALPRTYRAWIRFANASSSSDRARDIRGMSMRVFDVGGANLTAGATVQDFVLNSHPVMAAPDTRAFLELLRANETGGLRRAVYFLTHPKALRIGAAARTNPTCHLDIPYWSATPYLFGTERAVKYIAVPMSPTRSTLPRRLTDTYLTDALRARLEQGEATFDLMIQFQTDPRRMPIEDASVEWAREDAPYLQVARIRIPPQSFDDPARAVRCEQTAFTPWHCLAEHRPLGNMNRARRHIYPALAAFRTEPVIT